MQSARRVSFNPTSIPELRASKAHRQYHNVGNFPRAGLGLSRRNQAAIGRWKEVRRQSTETGEDQTGHIAAGSNEGILFFDSMKPQSSRLLVTIKPENLCNTLTFRLQISSP